MTKNGKPCVFPFKRSAGSTLYYNCVGKGSSAWCATSVDADGTYKVYGYCEEGCT